MEDQAGFEEYLMQRFAVEHSPKTQQVQRSLVGVSSQASSATATSPTQAAPPTQAASPTEATRPTTTSSPATCPSKRMGSRTFSSMEPPSKGMRSPVRPRSAERAQGPSGCQATSEECVESSEESAEHVGEESGEE